MIFSGKVSKIVQAQIYFFAVSSLISIEFSSVPFLKEGKLDYRRVKMEGSTKT